MSTAKTTTDHDTIRRWVESRNGHPSVVKATRNNRRVSGGLLRIDFGPKEKALDAIAWDEFFETFDRNNLTFLYQEKTASGRKSRFNKFVSRESAEENAARSGSGDRSEEKEDERDVAVEDEDEDDDTDIEDAADIEDEDDLEDEEDEDEDEEDEDEDEDEEDAGSRRSSRD